MVKELCKINSSALKYASDDLKKDDAYMREICKIKPYASYYASDDLKGDRDFVKELCKIAPIAIKYADYYLRNAINFVKELCEINPIALEYASAGLKQDEDFVKELYKIAPHIFEYASDDLRNDRNFVKELCKIDPIALQYVSYDLKKDKDYMNEINKIIDNSIPKNNSDVTNNKPNGNLFNDNEDKHVIRSTVKYPNNSTTVSKETIEQLRASLYDENGNLYDVSTFAGGYSDRQNKLNLLKEYERNYNSKDDGVTFATPEKVYGSKLSYEKKKEASEKKKQDALLNLIIQGNPVNVEAEYVCLQYEDGTYHDCYVYDYDTIEDLDCQYISYFDNNKGKIMYAPIKLENGELLKQEHTQEMINKIAMYQSEKLLKNNEFGGLDINSLPAIINHSKCYETIAIAAAGSSNNGDNPEEISVSTPIVDNNNLNNNWYNNGNNAPKKDEDKEEKQDEIPNLEEKKEENDKQTKLEEEKVFEENINDLNNLGKTLEEIYKLINNLYEEMAALKKENEMLKAKSLENSTGGKQI